MIYSDIAKCGLDCGNNGQCEEGRCRCDSGWSGSRCDQKTTTSAAMTMASATTEHASAFKDGWELTAL
ncbi:hypothetical protein CEXT_59241 [Caerostris extrusa]|uniref:EGF-like domain-containing protein n=1 Tax=Caerostris extrusa TaxID=172846 RepID=A0AAV4MC17_CAEEX|nr:hypothetical protein CEXT_59241 [Caerostris extrusa]